jgi:hypothetical protein
MANRMNQLACACTKQQPSNSRIKCVYQLSALRRNAAPTLRSPTRCDKGTYSHTPCLTIQEGSLSLCPCFFPRTCARWRRESADARACSNSSACSNWTHRLHAQAHGQGARPWRTARAALCCSQASQHAPKRGRGGPGWSSGGRHARGRGQERTGWRAFAGGHSAHLLQPLELGWVDERLHLALLHVLCRGAGQKGGRTRTSTQVGGTGSVGRGAQGQ